MNCLYDKEIGCPSNCPHQHLKNDVGECQLKRETQPYEKPNKTNIKHNELLDADLKNLHKK